MILAWCFILHFIADFLLQSREVATNKSSNINYLLTHCGILGVVFILGLYSFIGFNAIILACLNTIIHGAIDWNIWKVYKYFRRKEDIKTFKYWEDSLFYATIGFDQLLHSLTLIGLVSLIK